MVNVITQILKKIGLMKPTIEDADKVMTAAVAPQGLNLYEIRIPAGDHGSINIGWFNNGAPKLDPNEWLSKGYDGVKFVGAGVDVTHLRCSSYDGMTVAVIQHNGVVQFEDMTVHTGNDRGFGFGQQNVNKLLSPKFQARLINCKIVADPPSSYVSVQHPTGIRPKWLVFGYQCDLTMIGCTLNGYEAREHDVYFHGFANKGAYIERCIFEAAGAEGFKIRSDDTETVAVPGTNIIIRGCKFFNWRQDWSDRGGAGIVLQGCASNVLIEKCIFKPGAATANVKPNEKSHCIEIASEAFSYDAVTGKTGVGFGTGFVIIRDCAIVGSSLVDWNNSIVRVARNSGAQMAARAVAIERCGIYGPGVIVSMGQIPTGKLSIKNCNTAGIKDFCTKIGMDTSKEATFPTSQRRVPISEGIIR